MVVRLCVFRRTWKDSLKKLDVSQQTVTAQAGGAEPHQLLQISVLINHLLSLIRTAYLFNYFEKNYQEIVHGRAAGNPFLISSLWVMMSPDPEDQVQWTLVIVNSVNWVPPTVNSSHHLKNHVPVM